MTGDRVKFVTNHLKLGKKIHSEDDLNMIPEFVGRYLKQDGAFLLRLIAHNTNNITTTGKTKEVVATGLVRFCWYPKSSEAHVHVD